MPFEAQHTTVDGLTVRYYEAGEPFRDTLLLLHGNYGDAITNWTGMMDLLRTDYHLIAPDLPGFGGSDSLPNLSLDSLMSWCVKLISQLGLDQAACMGHSFGALLSRLLAAQHPNVVPYAIMISGGVIPNVSPVGKFIANLPLVGRMLFNQMNGRSHDDIAKSVHDKQTMNNDLIQATLQNTAAINDILYMLTLGESPTQRKPSVPVLIIWGENDTVSPLSVGQSVQKNIPSAQFLPIADCGNLPHVEAPDVLQWQIQGFVDTL